MVGEDCRLKRGKVTEDRSLQYCPERWAATDRQFPPRFSLDISKELSLEGLCRKPMLSLLYYACNSEGVRHIPLMVGRHFPSLILLFFSTTPTTQYLYGLLNIF